MPARASATCFYLGPAVLWASMSRNVAFTSSSTRAGLHVNPIYSVYSETGDSV
jgi:hypothetical protein